MTTRSSRAERITHTAACPTLLRRGFTLFEVVLATALAAVLMGLLGTALHVYLTSVSIGRSDVEQAQLARAVLSHIADDLRAAVRQVEQDVSSLASLGESGGSFDIGSLDDPGGAGGASQDAGNTGGSSSSGGSGSGTGMSSADLASATIPPPKPGLYGNQYQLQVDISRIPRFDELDALLHVEQPPSGYASDLRTVAYFVQQGNFVDESASAATGLGATEQQTSDRSGLMRREVDRAAALYSTEMAGGELLTQDAQLLAPEVTWMEFQYFDGVELWPEWDSIDRGGLPMAVEVRIWLRPPRPDVEMADVPAETTGLQSGPGDYDEMHRMVVHLPAAEPTSATDSTGGTTGGAGGTSGTSGTSGTGNSSASGTGRGAR